METKELSDYAWAAGYYEGEGSITARQIVRPSTRAGEVREYVVVNVRLGVSSTDKEPLDEMLRLFGGAVTGPHQGKKANHSAYWVWRITNWQQVTAVRDAIYARLSPRRRSQLDKAFELRPRTLRGPNRPPGCPTEVISSQTGYHRHKRNGEPVCDICQQSHAMAQREYRTRRAEESRKVGAPVHKRHYREHPETRLRDQRAIRP